MARYIGTADDDWYRGTAEADTIRGGAGYDTLYGEGGIDKIYGGNDDDELHGGDARDYLYGDAGGDFLYGDAGNDIVYGGEDDDYAYGGFGIDLLSGDSGNDVLRGEAGDDQLIGGAGNDTMRGGAGIDRVDGGESLDTVSFLDYAAKQGAVVDLRTGTVSNDGFGNAETVVSVERVTGTLNADTLLGTDTANIFWGGVGDTLRGFGGTDLFYVDAVRGTTLDGGTGVNSLYLMGAIDTVGPDGKVVTTYADQSMVIDLAKQQVVNDGFGYAAAITGFRNAGTADGDDTILGSNTANELRGGNGNDHLSGGGGNDLLLGDLGADTMTGGAGNDVFAFGPDGEYFFSSGETGDTITDFADGDKLDINPDFIPLQFVGTGSFDNLNFAIRYEIVAGNTYIYAKSHSSVNRIDLTVELLGAHQLTASDFLDLRPPAAMPLMGDATLFHSATHLGDLASLALA